jgi:hypothetical protein
MRAHSGQIENYLRARESQFRTRENQLIVFPSCKLELGERSFSLISSVIENSYFRYRVMKKYLLETKFGWELGS